MANILAKRLRHEKDLSLRVDMLHGDMTQRQREIVTNRFRKKQLNCLIATNVAARGLDFPHITHIFNYDIPDTVENYVHRVGRTSRMGSSGTAISLVVDDGKQLSQLYAIEQFIDLEIKRQHIKFSKSEHSASSNREKNIMKILVIGIKIKVLKNPNLPITKRSIHRLKETSYSTFSILFF